MLLGFSPEVPHKARGDSSGSGVLCLAGKGSRRRRLVGSEEVGAEGSGKRAPGGRQGSGVGEGLVGAGAPEEVPRRRAPVARPAALPPNRTAVMRLWKAAGAAEDRDFKLYVTVIHLNVKEPRVASGCPISRAALASLMTMPVNTTSTGTVSRFTIGLRAPGGLTFSLHRGRSREQGNLPSDLQVRV